MTIRFVIKVRTAGAGRYEHQREIAKKRVPVYVRIRDGREIDFMARSGLLVYPKWWNQMREEVSASCACPEEERLMLNSNVIGLRNFLVQNYMSDRIHGKICPEWLRNQMDSYYNNDRSGGLSLNVLIREFCTEHALSRGRAMQYEVVRKAIVRFESYVKAKNGHIYGHGFSFLDGNEKVFVQLQDYLLHENEYLQAIPSLIQDAGRPMRARSVNTVNGMLRKIRALLNWCVSRGYLEKSPFDSFQISGELYGTPVCMTTDEVLKLYHFDLEPVPLQHQRDIFVFQCNIGCRVSDLMRLTMANCNDGCISYIPVKTMRSSARTVTVPMNAIAREIFRKYANSGLDDGQHVFPCISVQKYNKAIKTIMRKAGITRLVTVLDPLTRTEKTVPICDMASSHMARRTFINSIYHKVKDPELVASLTGHSEGSRAFSRYRTIDTEMKKELVKLLESGDRSPIH